jgi:hypothetical protein
MISFHTIFRHLMTALFSCMLLLVWLPSADAFPKEGHFWGGAGVANVNHAAPTAFGWWGPRADVGVVFQLNDFWRINADLGASHHFQRTPDEDEDPIGPHTVLSTAIGARYALDVFTYIPYLGLSFVYHPLGPPSSQSPAGDPFSLRATLGVDYRRSRTLSYGAAIEVGAPLLSPADFPHYSGIRIHVGYHFRRF